MQQKIKTSASLILLTYNQEKFIRAAIDGAFSQTYSPLEIIISDDNSSDRTFEIIKNSALNYNGPATVKIRRSAANRGLTKHLQEAIKESSGEVIILAAGDDISLPERVTEIIKAFDESKEKSAIIYSDFTPIDLESKKITLDGEKIFAGPHSLEKMAQGKVNILGATTALTRNLITSFGEISKNVIHEDRVLPYRALLMEGGIIFINKKLVDYRTEGGVSRIKIKTTKDYLEKYIPSINQRTLPDAIQRLSDTLIKKPNNSALRIECETTITDHESRIDFSKTPRWLYEKKLIQWIFKGARPAPLIKHYIKLRLYSLKILK